MKDGTDQAANPTWSAQTIELVKLAKQAGLSEDQGRKIIDAFVNIDMAIKVTQQVERLLQDYKAGTLNFSEFADAIITILRTDRPLMGTKSEALHNALGIPIIAKQPRPPKPAATEPAAVADNIGNAKGSKSKAGSARK